MFQYDPIFKCAMFIVTYSKYFVKYLAAGIIAAHTEYTFLGNVVNILFMSV